VKILIYFFFFLLPVIGSADSMNLQFGDRIYLYPAANGTYDTNSPQLHPASTPLTINFPRNIRNNKFKEMIDDWKQNTRPASGIVMDGVTVHGSDTYFPVTYSGKSFIARVPTKLIEGRKYAEPKTTTEGRFIDPNCKDCRPNEPLTPAQKNGNKSMDDVLKASMKQPPSPPITQSGPRGLNDHCYNDFMSRDGRIMHHGQDVLNFMNKFEFYTKVKGSPFTEVCPNYENLSPKERDHFRVYFFTELVFRESSCENGKLNPKAVSQYGAWGYCQLNNQWHERETFSKEIRDYLNTPDQCAPGKQNSEIIKYGKTNLDCCVGIFAAKSTKVGSLFHVNDGFFQPMQPRYKTIGPKRSEKDMKTGWDQVLSEYERCNK